jgi:hypothetical protein
LLTKKTHPAHYCKGKIEQIDVQQLFMTHDEFRGSLEGNIIKYLWRWKYKGGIADLEKARIYLEWLIEHEKGKR